MSYLQLCFTVLFGIILLASQASTNPLDRRDLHILEPTKHVYKRTGITDLFYTARSSQNYVPLGKSKYWVLDPSKAAIFTTAEFYGCTVVIAVNGKSLVIAHYAESSGGCITMSDQTQVDRVIKDLQENELMVDADKDTQAWIINTAGTNSIGYKAIVQNLEDWDVTPDNIHNYPYFGGSGVGEYPGVPKGKAVVQWTPKSDNTGGATLNVYIENDIPKFTQDYDCNGNPISAGNHKRDGPACSRTVTYPTSSATAGPTSAPSCSYVAPEPPTTPEAFCSCGRSSLPLTTITGTPVPEASSCAYAALPTSAPSITNMATPTTNSRLCQVCTPYAANGADCSSITSCVIQAPQATVQVGSSQVHVGTLTSSALYTSISSALTKLCPNVTQTTEMTYCETGTVTIPNIPFSEGGVLNEQGELVVKVEASQYNVTSLRDAMINSAALTAENSAVGKNCYTAHVQTPQPQRRDYFYTSLRFARRWLGLEARESLHPEWSDPNWCNAASFAGVQYFGEYARLQPSLSPTDYIDVRWDFKSQGGTFTCEFLQGLIDALVAIAPEFAVGEIELGEAVGAACTLAMNH